MVTAAGHDQSRFEKLVEMLLNPSILYRMLPHLAGVSSG